MHYRSRLLRIRSWLFILFRFYRRILKWFCKSILSLFWWKHIIELRKTVSCHVVIATFRILWTDLIALGPQRWRIVFILRSKDRLGESGSLWIFGRNGEIGIFCEKGIVVRIWFNKDLIVFFKDNVSINLVVLHLSFRQFSTQSQIILQFSAHVLASISFLHIKTSEVSIDIFEN